MNTGLAGFASQRLPASLSFKEPSTLWLRLLAVFFSYLLAAEAAFIIGTLSDNIFAPFWPPNIVLLVVLLRGSRRDRLLGLAAAVPAHVIAEVQVGMTTAAIVVAFATNVAVAAGSAAAIKKLLGLPPWFTEFKRVATYILVVVLLMPGIVAFAGAFVPILAGGSLKYFWTYWLQWFFSNVIGNLTLAPLALMAFSQRLKAIWPAERGRQLELACCLTILAVMSAVVVSASSAHYAPAFLPAILYAPMPIILWLAARFGVNGAVLAIPTTAIVLIAGILANPNILSHSSAETNVFAMQTFLASVAVPVLLLGASIDQIKSAEKRRRRDKERIDFVAAAANVGLWSYNPSKNIFWTTSHCRELMGIPSAIDVTPDMFLANVHADDRALAAKLLHPKDATPDLSLFEFRVPLKNDEIRWLIGRATPSLNDSGDCVINGAVSDITPRKLAEHEANQQRHELAHLMRVSQVGELSGGLAHELTQPLTAILANAQAARMMLSGKRVESGKLREILDDIIAEDHRAGEVVKRIRGYLKKAPDAFEAVDINGLIKSTLHLLHSELISRHIRLAIHLENWLPAIHGDPIQLQQVLLNLVMNAIDSVSTMTTARRHILISTRTLPNGIELMVTDRGIGLSQTTADRVFEPFFTTKERGLGLGLSICLTIVKRHEGSLALQNSEDGGATACMRLPLNRKGA